jgi:hypothetical protein
MGVFLLSTENTLLSVSLVFTYVQRTNVCKLLTPPVTDTVVLLLLLFMLLLFRCVYGFQGNGRGDLWPDTARDQVQRPWKRRAAHQIRRKTAHIVHV